MSKALKLSLLAAAMAIGFTALAQTSAAPPKLPDPLLQAVRKAVASNPEVQARWHAFQAADSQRDIAKAGFLPQIDLSASIGNESRTTAGVSQGSYSLSSTQLSLNQILFDGFFTRNEVKRLGAAKLTRYYELLEASETAALEATRAYADVARYRELVDLATQNYVEHKQSALLVEERASAGVGRRVDVEQANGRLALAESNLLTELTNLHDVSARYLRVVGDMPAANLSSLPEPFKLGGVPASVDFLLRDGLMHSPTLRAAVENARSYRTAVDTAQAAYLPRVDLQVYGTQGNNSGGVQGDSRATGAAIALTYNLFRGGADKAREKQAVGLADQARDLQDKACRDVRQTLSLAYSDVRALNEQLGYIDLHRLATEKTREAYRQQFDIGQRSLLDLLDTQNEFFEASRSYINTRHDQAAAQARTLAAMGQLVTALGAERPDVPKASDEAVQSADLTASDLCPVDETVVDTLEKIKAGVSIPVRSKAAVPVVPLVLPVKEAPPIAVVEEAPPRKAPVVAKTPRFYRLHFALGKDVMLPQSDAVFKLLMEDYRSTRAPEVSIIGHTDRIGSAAINLDLSHRRTQAVFDRLTKEGVQSAKPIDQSWRGDKEPLPGTEAAVAEPRNRRVDVKIQ